MLIVVSRPEMVTHRLLQTETAAMNALFNEGLELLHLRKPAAGLADLTLLMEGVREKDYCKIVLHPPRMVFEQLDTGSAMIQIFEWMSAYGLHRFHVPGWLRWQLEKEGGFKLLSSAGHFIYSTGLHHWEELGQISSKAFSSPDYAYVLVSPLLNSLSKLGYKSNPALWQIPEQVICGAMSGRNNMGNNVKLIAMGGIQQADLRAVFNAGFGGAAMLGGVWPQLTGNSIQQWTGAVNLQFKKCQHVWQQLNKI